MTRLLAVLAIALATPTASAQDSHNHSAAAARHGSAIPAEPGQGAFGAIAEIAALLNADPHTDWTRVDIAALRAHLMDMQDLVENTVFSTLDQEGGVRFSIKTTGEGGEAALRMVPAHAPVLRQETGWQSVAERADGTLTWTVTSSNETDIAKIRALGFYGLMATGGHHPEHHLAIARGEGVH